MPKTRSRRKKVVTTSEGEKSVTTSESCDLSQEEATEEISSKEQMRLYCSHRKLIEPVPFGILQGTNLNKRCHDIISDPPADYLVERHNILQKSILIPIVYEDNLKDFIDSNRDSIFDREYAKYGVVRPSEWMRSLLVAMINVVFNLHEKNHFHGALQYIENYAISTSTFNFKYNHNDVEVILLYAKEDRDQLNAITNIATGVEVDFMAFSSVIFDEILGKGLKSYPEDFQHLYLLMTGNVSVGLSKRWLIASHPTLWHWETRLLYFEKVWRKYANGRIEVKNQIKAAAAKVRDAKNWWQKIPKGPFRMLYEANHYTKDGIGLLRYARITSRHLKDSDPDTGMRRYVEVFSEYDKRINIEMKLAEMFPMLLVDLYVALREVGIFV